MAKLRNTVELILYHEAFYLNILCIILIIRFAIFCPIQSVTAKQVIRFIFLQNSEVFELHVNYEIN